MKLTESSPKGLSSYSLPHLPGVLAINFDKSELDFRIIDARIYGLLLAKTMCNLELGLCLFV